MARHTNSGSLEAVACDSLTGPRAVLGPAERAALGKLEAYLLRTEGKGYKVLTDDNPEEVRLLPLPPFSNLAQLPTSHQNLVHALVSFHSHQRSCCWCWYRDC